MDERTHGGFGPTEKEWKAIMDDIQDESFRDADETLHGLDRMAEGAKDAGKVYSYTGKQYRFMRLAVKALFAMFTEHSLLSSKANGFRAQRIDAIEERLEALDGIAVSKSLDIEVYDSMRELVERIERLESNLQEIAENGLLYRGYWRDGMKAKRGEAYTDDGSVWWCIRNTLERPHRESADWQIAVRKGRDGKGACL